MLCSFCIHSNAILPHCVVGFPRGSDVIPASRCVRCVRSMCKGAHRVRPEYVCACTFSDVHLWQFRPLVAPVVRLRLDARQDSSRVTLSEVMWPCLPVADVVQTRVLWMLFCLIVCWMPQLEFWGPTLARSPFTSPEEACVCGPLVRIGFGPCSADVGLVAAMPNPLMGSVCVGLPWSVHSLVEFPAMVETGYTGICRSARARPMLGGSDAVYHPQDARSDQGGSSGAPGPLVPTVARGDHGDSSGAPGPLVPTVGPSGSAPSVAGATAPGCSVPGGGGSLVRRPPLLRGSCLMVWLPQG